MLIGEILRVALSALRANKLRSMLTMLGIVIGVAAVITMVALGRGAQKAVNERLQSLGTTLLSVREGQVFRGGIASSSDRARLEVDDAVVGHGRTPKARRMPRTTSSRPIAAPMRMKRRSRWRRSSSSWARMSG